MNIVFDQFYVYFMIIFYAISLIPMDPFLHLCYLTAQMSYALVFLWCSVIPYLLSTKMSEWAEGA